MTITIETGVTVEAGIYVGALTVYRNPHTITTIPSAKISNAQVKFGTGSYTSLPGNGGLKVTPTTDFAFGQSNFTIEYWIYPTAYADTLTVDMRPINTTGAYPSIYPRATGATSYYTTGAVRITSSTTATPLNQWSSVAVVRYNSVTKLYINGVQEGIAWADTTNYIAGSCTIACNGYSQNGTLPVPGYMDEIRISNIARYTGPYTPATEPFVNDANTLLLLQFNGPNGSTVFVDTTTSS